MPKILIVDDSKSDLKVMRAILENAGEDYEIFDADSGKSALAHVDAVNPDLVLLDVIMPEMDGFEVCRRLKADKKHRSIPILFITAMGKTDDVVKGYQLGCADYISKPINTDEARVRVSAQLRIKELEDKEIEMEKIGIVKQMVETYHHHINQHLMAAYVHINVAMGALDTKEAQHKKYQLIKLELDKLNSVLKKIKSVDSEGKKDYAGIMGTIDIHGAEALTETLKDADDEEHKLQKHNLRTTKMNTLGEISAGIMHELNQPLMAITTHIEAILLNQTVSADEKLSAKMKKIREQFYRLGTIVRRVSSFNKARAESFMLDEIKTPIEDSLFLIAQQLKDHNIELSQQIEEDMPMLYFDRYLIQDVIINFTINARDAVDEVYGQDVGGKINVATHVLTDEGAVIVGVSDNGKQIPDSIEGKLFEQFFTTKGPEKGTGLGLPVCREIMDKHHGLISFVRLSDGTKMFYFALPLDKDKNLADDPEIKKNIENKLKTKISHRALYGPK